MRILTMPPVISALPAFDASRFRSQISLRLENLALRHQLAVYQQTIPRSRLYPTDRLVWVWLSRLWSGWQVALAEALCGTPHGEHSAGMPGSGDRPQSATSAALSGALLCFLSPVEDASVAGDGLSRAVPHLHCR